jgi:8-oxo-dGTP pyrophosphatase MutT (NUDIX family)
MPHIHTAPNQHDITVSAYIVRVDGTEPKVLVHMHRKFHKLLQVGGHVELDETPWASVAHELLEESGYTLEELDILQPDAERVIAEGAVVHPVPVLSNTHKIGDSHFHSDFCYAFVAKSGPHNRMAEGESEDLRWLTLAELKDAVEQGLAAHDAYIYYEAIITRYLAVYYRIPASDYSIEKPTSDSL